MKERTRNLVVGLTAIAGLLALAYLIFIFGEMPAWTGEFYRVQFTIADASGLTEGSRIRLAGVDVGEIEQIRLHENPSLGVRMLGRIEADYEIPAGSKALAEGSLLGGAAALNIIPPPPDAPPAALAPLPKTGEGVIEARSVSITRQLSEMTEGLGGGLEEQLENFSRVSESILKLSAEYTELGKELRGLVAVRDLAAVDAGRASPNLYTALARADKRLQELAETTRKLNALIGDEQMIENLRATVANARQFTENATELTENAGDQLQALTKRYIAVADELGQSLDSLNLLLAQARTGQGTLGKLMQDPELYNAFTDAAYQLNDALKEARLLIQKWKAEGLPVQF